MRSWKGRQHAPGSRDCVPACGGGLVPPNVAAAARAAAAATDTAVAPAAPAATATAASATATATQLAPAGDIEPSPPLPPPAESFAGSSTDGVLLEPSGKIQAGWRMDGGRVCLQFAKYTRSAPPIQSPPECKAPLPTPASPPGSSTGESGLAPAGQPQTDVPHSIASRDPWDHDGSNAAGGGRDDAGGRSSKWGGSSWGGSSRGGWRGWGHGHGTQGKWGK